MNYRQKAQECRERAKTTLSEDDRAAWLKMADEWDAVAESLDNYERDCRGRRFGSAS